MKKPFAFFLLSLSLNFLHAQENFSAGTGASVLRNFSPQQTFWALGHTLQATVHFSAKQSAYAWIEYYTDGKFRNDFTASAKSASLSPQRINFTATGRLTYRHFSAGWKRYLSGGYRAENSVSVYSLAGFGLLFASVQNSFSTPVDTTFYSVPAKSGEGNVRKLTFDLGIGAERPLNRSVCIFADVRTWLPASSNESKYLHNQRNLPLPVMLTAGIRVLVGPEYD